MINITVDLGRSRCYRLVKMPTSVGNEEMILPRETLSGKSAPIDLYPNSLASVALSSCTSGEGVRMAAVWLNLPSLMLEDFYKCMQTGQFV